VSLQDYATVALQFPAVSKAKATSSVSTSVQLYVHPVGGPYDATTLESMVDDAFVGLGRSLTNATQTGWLDTRKPAGTTVTVLPPNYDGAVGYMPIVLTVNVAVLPTYDTAQVKANVVSALTALLDFGTVGFGQLITQSSIWHTVEGVPGVDWLTVSELRRGDNEAGTLGNIQCAAYEIPLLLADNVTINLAGGL
jgi:uncharacterized phage protein gp47/JayE